MKTFTTNTYTLPVSSGISTNTSSTVTYSTINLNPVTTNIGVTWNNNQAVWSTNYIITVTSKLLNKDEAHNLIDKNETLKDLIDNNIKFWVNQTNDNYSVNIDISSPILNLNKTKVYEKLNCKITTRLGDRFLYYADFSYTEDNFQFHLSPINVYHEDNYSSKDISIFNYKEELDYLFGENNNLCRTLDKLLVRLILDERTCLLFLE